MIDKVVKGGVVHGTCRVLPFGDYLSTSCLTSLHPSWCLSYSKSLEGGGGDCNHDVTQVTGLCTLLHVSLHKDLTPGSVSASFILAMKLQLQ